LSGDVVLRHCSVTDNTGYYGGVSNFGDVTLDHTIVANNRDRDGAPVDVRVRHGATMARFTIIGSSQGSSLAEAPIGAPDVNGNLIGGPMYGIIHPRLGPLADHGGPTLPGGAKLLTHALLPGSPAIDAGDPSGVPGTGGVPEFDQRGPRFARVAGVRIDIGAVEVQPPSGLLHADFDGNGLVNGSDLLVWQRNLGKAAGASLREGDATADGDVDANDLAVWRATFGSMVATTPEVQERPVTRDKLTAMAVAALRAPVTSEQSLSRLERARTRAFAEPDSWVLPSAPARRAAVDGGWSIDIGSDVEDEEASATAERRPTPRTGALSASVIDRALSSEC
jgi:hypothetical protein